MGSSDGYVVLVVVVSVGQLDDRIINDSLFGSVDGLQKDTPFDNWSTTVATAEQRCNVFFSTGWTIHQRCASRRGTVVI